MNTPYTDHGVTRSAGTWQVRTVSHSWPFRVAFTHDVWLPSNPALGEAFNDSKAVETRQHAKSLVVADCDAIAATPELQARIEQRFTLGDLPPLSAVLQLPGGEQSKNDSAHLDTLYAALIENNIDRRSFVLAVGGGAFLDTVGYAAATLHRGVRLIRLPTTTLAQCDSGIGVKNAVNRLGVKNAVGTFAVPWAVVNDFVAIRTLPDDVWRHGFAECVKVALLKDADFFCWLEAHSDALASRDEALAEHAWRRSAELHMQHIAEPAPLGGGDPFEANQARPLDFGHWAAHRLEELSRHDIPHGPAVSIGLSVDLRYSARVGLVSSQLADRAIALLAALGLPTGHRMLAHPELSAGLERFRQHLGGQLTLTMVRGLADPFELHTIDRIALNDTLQERASVADPISV